jgi:MYXO-CTERM domain-containing protein
MKLRTPLIAAALLAAGIGSSAHAALEGRDLDGNVATFEAYYDTVLDITWLADANYAMTSGYDADGLMTWADANAWAAQLSFTDGLNVYDEWRLPTVEPVNGSAFDNSSSTDGSTDSSFNITSPNVEMAHLFYVTLGNPGYYTQAGAQTGCGGFFPPSCLFNVGPFTNLQANQHNYWSATEAMPPHTDSAWNFSMYTGLQSAGSKSFSFYALAVSPGDVVAVPETDTWAMLLAGLGLVGLAARRRSECGRHRAV